MGAGNTAILEAFSDLLTEHGVAFTYSGDDAEYTGLVNDGYSSSTVNMIQLQPGKEFAIRFLASDWETVPTRMATLTADGVAYTITQTIKELPLHGIFSVVCRLQ